MTDQANPQPVPEPALGTQAHSAWVSSSGDQIATARGAERDQALAADAAAAAERARETAVTIIDAAPTKTADAGDDLVTLGQPANGNPPAGTDAPSSRQALDILAVGAMQPASVSVVMAHYRESHLGNVALSQMPDAEANMAFALPTVALIANGIRDPERRFYWMGVFEEANEANQLALLESLFSVGRHLAVRAGAADTVPTTPTSTATSKGNEPVPEQMTRNEAEKRFKELTTKFHTAMSNGRSWEAQEIDKERTDLLRALNPGMNAPPGIFPEETRK